MYQCKAISTRSGKRCQRNINDASQLCGAHKARQDPGPSSNPQHVLRHEETSQGTIGEETSTPSPSPSPSPSRKRPRATNAVGQDHDEILDLLKEQDQKHDQRYGELAAYIEATNVRLNLLETRIKSIEDIKEIIKGEVTTHLQTQLNSSAAAIHENIRSIETNCDVKIASLENRVENECINEINNIKISLDQKILELQAFIHKIIESLNQLKSQIDQSLNQLKAQIDHINLMNQTNQTNQTNGGRESMEELTNAITKLVIKFDDNHADNGLIQELKGLRDNITDIKIKKESLERKIDELKGTVDNIDTVLEERDSNVKELMDEMMKSLRKHDNDIQKLKSSMSQ